MLDFTDLRIEEREILQPYLLADGSIQSDRCFSSLYIWSEHYKLKKCIKDGFLFLRAEMVMSCFIICPWEREAFCLL